MRTDNPIPLTQMWREALALTLALKAIFLSSFFSNDRKCNLPIYTDDSV